jgi:hypothetical protein
MVRRLTISALWFVAFFCLHELAWSVFGSPRVLGLAIGCLAAAFVWVDPIRIVRPAATARPDGQRLEAGLDPR